MRALLALSFALLLSLVCTNAAFASEGFDDLVKLIKSGINEEVVLAYVNSSPSAYDLAVDEILYLNDLGVSPKVITAAVDHGKLLRSQGPAPVVAADPPAPPVQPAQPLAPAPVPAVDPVAQDPVIGKPDPVAPQAGVVNDQAQPPPQAAQETVESEVIERPAVVVAPEPQDANISFFYDAMSPYGKWIELDGQWMWQPTVAIADPEWRPYCNSGQWLLTDQGWAWNSSYSWGWAPFHYGRWSMSAGHGWVWAPDNTWGPAWVSWRTCDSHYGWAPLPPAARFEAGIGFSFNGNHVGVGFEFGLRERDYSFVAAEHFYEPHAYLIPAAQVSVVYNRTTIIENNYTYNDNRIINRGPAANSVAAATGRAVKPVMISDAQVRPGEQLRGNHVAANEFRVYRPAIAASAPVKPPALVERRQAAMRQAVRETPNTVARPLAQTTNTSAQPYTRTQPQSQAQSTAASDREARIRNADAKRQERETARAQAEAQRRAIEPAARNTQPVATQSAQREREQEVRREVPARAPATEAVTREQPRINEPRTEAAQPETVRNAAEPRQEREPEAQVEAQRRAATEASREASRQRVETKKYPPGTQLDSHGNPIQR